MSKIFNRFLDANISYGTYDIKYVFFRFRQYQPEPLETAAPRLDHYGRELLIGFLKVRI